MVRRKEQSELELAEIKLETLVEKRNALNADAAVFREERDLLNAQRREIIDHVREIRARRGAALDELRAHKARRDDLQKKAKELIELKRRTRSKVQTSIRADLDRVRREVRQLEMSQQTSSLKLEEENDLLDEIRAKLRDLKDLEALHSEQDRIAREVNDIDASITEMFREADKNHEQVVRLSTEGRAKREEIAALMTQVTSITAEADKKHEEYLKIRNRADEFHEKAVEMRTRVLATREAYRAENREARNMIRQQNLSVQRELLDERKLDSAAEEALRLLLAKGRVEIKG
ncbi:MAG TPA: hypothetical protein VJ207_03350 [Thermoplasmata archaeon]|nr:hypothetical protein [Thermoplasmata archaeon]